MALGKNGSEHVLLRSKTDHRTSLRSMTNRMSLRSIEERPHRTSLRSMSQLYAVRQFAGCWARICAPAMARRPAFRQWVASERGVPNGRRARESENFLACDPVVPQSPERRLESMARSISYYGQSRSLHVASVDGPTPRCRRVSRDRRYWAQVCPCAEPMAPAFPSVGRLRPNGQAYRRSFRRARPARGGWRSRVVAVLMIRACRLCRRRVFQRWKVMLFTFQRHSKRNARACSKSRTSLSGTSSHP